MIKTTPPILADKHWETDAVFRPENLLREARRQKGLPAEPVPDVCVLDPDGDIVRHLRQSGRGRRMDTWACYHTALWRYDQDGRTVGVIGCAVGASFAVLLAEQLFASGCKLLISVTSAGQITAHGPPPYFVLIDRALRDEGTSYHYLPPSDYADADPALIARVAEGLKGLPEPVHIGASWTTDAPYRETDAAIAAAARGILAVEMEAAALYAFARREGRAVVCFAHVTNQMAQDHGDFEKGGDEGVAASLAVIAAAAKALHAMEKT